MPLVPFFSVIIPCRNRPQLLERAVKSVSCQQFTDFEVVVVDDGSEPALNQEYLETFFEDKLRVVRLAPLARGRGPAYSRNVGVWNSTGSYCAFLDDDDYWLDDQYLGIAFEAIQSASAEVDALYSNQQAAEEGSQRIKHLWLYSLGQSLLEQKRCPEQAYTDVSIEELLGIDAFCHMNTTIVSRTFFEKVGGLDEYVPYEEDLDFYIRCLDRAGKILFRPGIVSQHTIPDAAKRENASTGIGELQKLHTRCSLLTRNFMLCERSEVSRWCRKRYVNSLKLLAERNVELGRIAQGSMFARQVLGVSFSVKWLLYSGYLTVLALFKRGKINER